MSKQNAIVVLGMIVVFVLCIALMIPSGERKAKASMDKQIVQDKIQYEESMAVADEAEQEMEALSDVILESWNNKLCSQCRAFHRRAGFCNDFENPEVCEQAQWSMNGIEGEWFGNVYDLCYEAGAVSDGYEPCIKDDYPFEM